jgi:hypothetical protein
VALLLFVRCERFASWTGTGLLAAAPTLFAAADAGPGDCCKPCPKWRHETRAKRGASAGDARTAPMAAAHILTLRDKHYGARPAA